MTKHTANSKDDDTLIERIQQSDEKAFQQLFHKYYPDIYRCALRILTDPGLSKDVAQEVFLNLWKLRATLNIRSSLRGYLIRSATNHSLNQLKKRRRTTELPNVSRSSENDVGRPDTLLNQQEIRETLRAGINLLPGKCRQVFLLSRYEGLSTREIAEQLNISPKTVENHMTKALRILRSKLHERHPELKNLQNKIRK